MQSAIKSLTINERPQERLASKGPGALSDTELLAIILRKGTQQCDVLTLAHRMLKSTGTLRGLLNLDVSDFKTFPGIGDVKAYQLIAHMELSRRLLQSSETSPIMDTPEGVFEWLLPMAEGLSVEKFWTMSLNRKNRLIRCEVITSGTATASLVHPREVFRAAIRNSATAIICAHNHPSGDPSPSQADIRVTKQLREAAKVVQIDLLDHIVIGSSSLDPTKKGFYSFAESGLL